jgi:uncharacterized membrane protein
MASWASLLSTTQLVGVGVGVAVAVAATVLWWRRTHARDYTHLKARGC